MTVLVMLRCGERLLRERQQWAESNGLIDYRHPPCGNAQNGSKVQCLPRSH
jgi:hypothetical protein